MIDVSDPYSFQAVGTANPTALDGRVADTWSAKLWNGYVFTDDMGRGMDIFKLDGAATPLEITRAVENLQRVHKPKIVRDNLPEQAGQATSVRFNEQDKSDRPLLCFELKAARSL